MLPADRLGADRAEGRLLACAYSEGAWFGVSKVPADVMHESGERRTDHGRPSQRHRRAAPGVSRASRRNQRWIDPGELNEARIRTSQGASDK